MDTFDFDAALRRMTAELTALPAPGTPAAELTERDKVALVLASGADYKIHLDPSGRLVVQTTRMGVADRGDGGYILAFQQAPRHGHL